METFPKLAGYKMQSLMQKVRLSLATKWVFVSEQAWRVQDSNCYKMSIGLFFSNQVKIAHSSQGPPRRVKPSCSNQPKFHYTSSVTTKWHCHDPSRHKCMFTTNLKSKMQLLQGGIPTTNHTAPKCYKMGFGFNIPIKNQKNCYYKMTIGYGPSAVWDRKSVV